jgi:hypothetical protein
VGSPAPTALDDELRGILQDLTEGMFPLAAWVEDKIENGGYKPREHLPWRDAGSSLATKDLGAVEFFEELLGQSADGLSITERLAQVIADPAASMPQVRTTHRSSRPSPIMSVS